ncbi:MAG TPA: ABC transporter substrate binding protein, partial [Pseudolabrys sp.]
TLPPKAGMCGATEDVRYGVCGANRHVRFGPIADSCTAAKRTAIRSLRRRSAGSAERIRSIYPAASLTGKATLIYRRTGNLRAVEKVFATLAELKADALLVLPDVSFLSRREQLVRLAANSKVPTIYYSREYVAAGGLLSYGASLGGMFRQAGNYVGRILGGAIPADLPVAQPTKFELVINLKTAKTLGLSIPATLIARADEVIE